MSDIPKHLEEVSTKERIALVDNDRIRRLGQISIALILIGAMISYLFWYTLFAGDAEFKLAMANDMKVLLIMGVGAALAIFGLGRTVGRTRNNNPPNTVTVIEHPETPDSFTNRDDELRDLIEHQDEDRPGEVPIGKGDEFLPPTDANIKPESTYFLADRDSWNNDTKRIKGNAVIHVAIQQSRRSNRKRTIHVYYIHGTNIVVYNRSRDGVYFMRIAIRPENVNQFYDVFVREPVTPPEQEWLERYDYVITTN